MNSWYSFFLTCIFLNLLASLPAQQNDITSLVEKLNTVQGKERVDVLNALVGELKSSKPEQARKYAEEAFDLSQRLTYSPGLISSSFFLGTYYRDARNYALALQKLKPGLESARDKKDYASAMVGLDIAKSIYQKTNRPKKIAEVDRLYRQAKTRLELNQTSSELAELEKVVELQDDVLSLSEQEKQQISAEMEAALSDLAQSTEENLRKAAELAIIAQERAELESKTMRLEKESMELEKQAVENALKLEKERNIRNLAIALIGVLLFLLLAGWQRYRYKRQQKLAEIEKQRVQRLQEIDRLKDQFLANTSHELRTPLNGIIGIAEWMHSQKNDLKPDVLQSNLSMVISAGKRLQNLVNDIMDFSRLKNADLQLHLKPVDLFALSTIVMRFSQPMAAAKKLKLVNAIPKDLPAILADEDRLQQILHNLVGNAIKFTKEGTVKIATEPSGKMLKVAISDTGIGIPLEKHESIFQAFHQEDGTTVREFSGTGLGLSITRHLVELHQGEIWVESEPGAGATFYFTLPLTDQAATNLPQEEVGTEQSVLLPLQGQAPAEASIQVGSSSNGHQVNILIVDDEPINQHVLRNHLDAEYYKITKAMDGEEALHAIDVSEPFDLIVLDVMMPRMSGYEVCEKIREKYLPSELPIIMVTAKNLVKDLVEGLSTGANDYLAKPFSREEFLARVKTQLNLHQINQATGRFVPNAFLKTLGRENITEVQLGDQVEQLVTVFFCDIRGYTTLSESMTPEENFKFVRSFHSRLGPIIDLNGGFVNQYLGDAIMAIFQKSPMDALRSSIAFQQSLYTYNEERQKKNRKPISVGIGFHTGKLIMGIIGDNKRHDAATISDTVNTAARMESLNKHYGTNILFSEDSLLGMEAVEDFHFRYLGKVQMKGKHQAVGIYECFDGDPVDLIAQKKQHLEIFNNGINAFFAKDFKGASQFFAEVVRLAPGDMTTQIFLRKSLKYLDTGIPPDWTGIQKMEVK